MKKFTMLICAILVLMMVSPVQAARHVPIGDQINIYESGSQEFEAGKPFYISHGWIEVEYAFGRFDFRLEVDDVFVEESYVDRTVIFIEDEPYLDMFWVYNFPDGMTETHTFKGHWYYPCLVALADGLTTECSNDAAFFEAHTTEVTITFTP